MLAQNVQAPNMTCFFTVVKGQASIKSGNGASFENFLQNVGNGSQGNSPVTKATTDTVKEGNGGRESKNDTGLQTENDKPMQEDARTRKADKTEMKELSDTEYVEKASSLINQIVETVKDYLKLSEEELNSLLEQLGMSQIQLVDQEQLKSLVLLSNQSSDLSMLLTNEGLLNTFNDLQQEISNLLQESGISMEELLLKCDNSEFQKLLNKALEGFEMTKSDEDFEQEKDDLSNLHSEDNNKATAMNKTKTMELDFKENVQGKETAGVAEKKEQITASEEITSAEQFVNHLQNTIQKTNGLSETQTLVAEIREVANQILEKVRVVVAPDTTSLEIQLTPEHLGKVSLTISDKDGVMTAKFLTESQVSKEAIESNLIQFKEMLQEKGLVVDSIEVAVSDFSFEKEAQSGQSNQEEQQRNNKRHFVIESDEFTGLVSDQLGNHFIQDGESTVNYIA